MKPILTERLVIRNWRDEDRALFHRINSDERVMAFFPFRRDRAGSDALLDRLRAGIEENGFGFCALERRDTGECIGFTGLNLTDGLPGLPQKAVEIGWRLAPDFWGRGYVREAAKAWLDEGFTRLSLQEIVSFAVWNNVRSIAVMQRIGMRADPEGDFDHPSVPDTHPHLKCHALYRLTREEWQLLRASTSEE